MDGKRYVCRVVREYGSLGPFGLVLHNVGDEVVRDTEPAEGAPLELVSVVNPAELTSEPVKAPAGEPVVNPEAVTEAQAAAGSGDAAAPAAEAAAPAAPARKKAQAAAG
jgi:hypothetical protein